MSRRSMLVFALVIMLGPLQLAKPALGRVWRDQAAKHQTQGIMVEREGDEIVLEKDDGTRVRLALEQLSDEDRQHVLGRVVYPERSWSDTKRSSLANGPFVEATETLVRVKRQELGRWRSIVLPRRELSERDQRFLASEAWHRGSQVTWNRQTVLATTNALGCEGTIPKSETFAPVSPLVDRLPRRAHADSIFAFTISLDHRLAASAGHDIKLWAPGDARLVAAISNPFNVPVSSLVFSPDGVHLAATAGEQYRVWKVADRQVVREGTARGLNALTFSADGRSLRVIRNDGFDVLSGAAFETHVEQKLSWPPGRKDIRTVVEIDDDLIAVAGPPIQIVSRSGKVEARDVEARYGESVEKVEPVLSLVVTPNKKHVLAICNSYVELISVETAESIRRIDLQGQLLGVSKDASFIFVSDVYIAQDGRRRCDVGVRSLSDGSLLTSMPVRLAYDAQAVGISADGQMLYAATPTGMIYGWCLRERRWIVWLEDIELRKVVKSDDLVYRYLTMIEEDGKKVRRYKYVEYFYDLPLEATEVLRIPKSQMASAAASGYSSGGSSRTTYTYTIITVRY